MLGLLSDNFIQPLEPKQAVLPNFAISLSCCSDSGDSDNIEVVNSALVNDVDVNNSDLIESVNSADVGNGVVANNPNDDIEGLWSPGDNVTEYDKSDTGLYSLDDCNVTVIGDSNLRFMGGLLTNYQVAFRPGAKFTHITDVVKAIPKSSTCEHLVVAMGVNHRDRDYNKETLPDLRTLVESLRNCGKTAHFLGLSYNSKLAPELKANLSRINKAAQLEFKHCFIQPLPDDKICTKPDGIHHVQYTVNAIRDSIVAHITSLN